MVFFVICPSVNENTVFRLHAEVFLEIVDYDRLLQVSADSAEVFDVLVVLVIAVVSVESVGEKLFLRVYTVENYISVFLEG